MEQTVQIKLHRPSGALLLYPMGTFKGYGAYVAVHPFLEFAPPVRLAELGQQIAGLLGLARATGVHVRDVAKFRAADGAGYEAVRLKYLRDVRSTSDDARLFDSTKVKSTRGRKYWTATHLKYDATLDGLVPDRTVRVPQADGVASLGATVAMLLGLTEPSQEGRPD